MDQPTPDAGANIMQAISNEMVRVYKDQFGRGPTKTRAFFAGPDTILVVLQDTLTRAERNLAEMGEHQRLRDVRLFFQYASIEALCEPIERLTGRRVRSFVSGMDTLTDYSVEVFELHPEGADEPSRREFADGLSD